MTLQQLPPSQAYKFCGCMHWYGAVMVERPERTPQFLNPPSPSRTSPHPSTATAAYKIKRRKCGRRSLFFFTLSTPNLAMLALLFNTVFSASNAVLLFFVSIIVKLPFYNKVGALILPPLVGHFPYKVDHYLTSTACPYLPEKMLLVPCQVLLARANAACTAVACTTTSLPPPPSYPPLPPHPPQAYDVATDFMTEHRGWFVIFFVLPFSLLFDVFFKIRAAIVMRFYSAPELHSKRVEQIQAQIKAHHESGSTKRLCTARGGWQSISPGNRDYKTSGASHQISVNLYDILHFDDSDADNLTIRVEPMVNMGQISHYLAPLGYTIPVLPEMDDLTVGGLMMGVGIETSSHKYGLFNDTVVELELVLSDGSCVSCSKTKNRELFDACPWSYGTLGMLTAVTIKVMKSKPFVKLEYFPCYEKKMGAKLFSKLSEEQEADFVESLAYSEHEQVRSGVNGLPRTRCVSGLR